MVRMYDIIDALCKKSGMNITTMCKELKIPRSVLSELKAERTKTLSGKYLSTLASYFGVTVDYLLGNEQKKLLINEDEELTEYLEQLKNRKEMRMLFSLTKGATKEDVERTVKIVEDVDCFITFCSIRG